MNQDTSSSRQEEERDLRSAVQYAVAKICENQADDGARMTEPALAALAELTYRYATTSLPNDLVWFSRHANRRTVTVDDVKLVARKNPNLLLEQLESYTEQRKLPKGNHSLEAVRKQREQSTKKKTTPPLRNSSARKKRKQQKSVPSNQEDGRRNHKEQDRLLLGIDDDDSSQDSLKQFQDIDMESTDSDRERALRARLEQRKLERINRMTSATEGLESSESDEGMSNDESCGFKRLKKGTPTTSQASSTRKTNRRLQVSPRKQYSLDDNSDSCGDETKNKENGLSRKSSIEVIELMNSQELPSP